MLTMLYIVMMTGIYYYFKLLPEKQAVPITVKVNG